MNFQAWAGAALATAVIWAGAGHAATLPSVTISKYDAQTFAAQQTAMANRRVETFENIAVGETFGGVATQVGRFDTLGGTGSGGTVSGTRGNTGTALYLRDRSTFGRVNTTSGGSRFLDSNDTYGISWTIGGLGFFDALLFTISDFGDAGGKLTIASGGSALTTVLAGRKNGLVDTVAIQFGAAVDSAVLTFRMSKLNDGFGIDDVTVGSNLPAVPLPPAILLLGGAAAGLVMLRRRTRPA